MSLRGLRIFFFNYLYFFVLVYNVRVIFHSFIYVYVHFFSYMQSKESLWLEQINLLF